MKLDVEAFRLSKQQLHLWSTHNHGLFATRCLLSLQGKLDYERLRMVLDYISRQHAILRTSFRFLPQSQTPVQQILLDPHYLWQEVNLSHLSEVEQAQYIRNVMVDLVSHVTNEKPFFVTLYTLSLQKHYLLLQLSALCGDRQTLTNIVQQISIAYTIDDLSQVSRALDVQASLQYIQFAEWQHQLATSEDDDTLLAQNYWQKQNQQEVKPLALRGQNHKTSWKTFSPQTLEQTLSSAVLSQLRKQSTEFSHTTHTTLFATWFLFLYRLTGESDLSLKHVVGGRFYEELQKVSGPFAFAYPVTLSLRETTRVKELFTLVEEALSGAEEWQEYFLVINPTQTVKGIDDHLFFSFETSAYQQTYETSGMTWSIEQLQCYTDLFALKIEVKQSEQSLTIILHYDSFVFSKERARLILEQFLALLQNCLSFPEETIQSLPLQSVHEQQIMLRLNTSERDFLHPEFVHKQFEEQALQNPDRPALVFEETSLTYRQVNQRANQLAQYLRKQGLVSGSLIGIHIDRSQLMVVAILAVLKAGGAYVPFDTDLPEKRLLLLLEEINSEFIITQNNLTHLYKNIDVQLICLDTHWPQIQQETSYNLSLSLQPQQLAYMIFTSGTTGKPKGVMIEHQQLANYVFGIQKTLPFPNGGNYAFVSTFAADLGNTVLFPALCSGGCLHILSKEYTTNADILADYFSTQHIDVVKIAPSHMQTLLLSSFHPQQLLPRQLLILGGEVLHWNVIEQIRTHLPSCRIVNHYGPTETTVGVLTHSITTEEQSLEAENVSLSQTLPGIAIYLLDQYMQPVPFGAVGELYIGGKSLARGYFQEPSLTAERFLPDPFGNALGARLYKTGDRAYQNTDGSIIIIGRSDRQVKFHGHRLELNEIEVLLKQHPQIQESIVLLKQDEKNTPLLVAYYLSRQALKHEELRTFLEEMIGPEFLPHHFLHLRKVPLLTSGKIDYRALPDIETLQPQRRRSVVLPRNQEEELLTQIWSNVLGVDNVGIHDNFFELWGDSIQGMQIIAGARQAGLEITLKQLFQQKTIANLASVATWVKVQSMAEQLPIVGTYPLTPIQRRFFACFNLHSHPEKWHVTVILETNKQLESEFIQQTLLHLIQHHDILRSLFDGTASAVIQEQPMTVPFLQRNFANLSIREADEAQEQLVREIQQVINISQGPLLGAGYISLRPNLPDRLVFVVHRLVVDGMSWRILLEHFSLIYAQLLSKQHPIQLPSKTTSYKYWAENLVAEAQKTIDASHMHYWLQKHWENVVSLPWSLPPSHRESANEQSHTLIFTPEETDIFLQTLPEYYHTEAQNILFTLLATSIARWSTHQTLLFDIEGHGRETQANEVDLTQTVGWFTTVAPLLMTFPDPNDPVVILKTIKEEMHSLSHHTASYGLLRYLIAEKDVQNQLQQLPQAEILIRYTGQFHHADNSYLKLLEQREPLLHYQPYRLIIVGNIFDEQLHVTCFYRGDKEEQRIIAYLAQEFIQTFKQLYGLSQTSSATGFVPSDFPLASLNQGQLNDLLKRLEK